MALVITLARSQKNLVQRVRQDPFQLL
jgi:hypothetical protein